MSKYTVRLTYEAVIDVEVEAKDEGEALDKARDYAEIEADSNQFSICNEKHSRILSTE